MPQNEVDVCLQPISVRLNAKRVDVGDVAIPRSRKSIDVSLICCMSLSFGHAFRFQAVTWFEPPMYSGLPALRQSTSIVLYALP